MTEAMAAPLTPIEDENRIQHDVDDTAGHVRCHRYDHISGGLEYFFTDHLDEYETGDTGDHVAVVHRLSYQIRFIGESRVEQL